MILAPKTRKSVEDILTVMKEELDSHGEEILLKLYEIEAGSTTVTAEGDEPGGEDEVIV